MGWFSKPLKFSPVNRLRFAWSTLIGSLVLWPVTQLTVGRDEPPVIFALSWLAVTYTALDILFTTDVRVSVEGDAPEAGTQPEA